MAGNEYAAAADACRMTESNRVPVYIQLIPVQSECELFKDLKAIGQKRAL